MSDSRAETEDGVVPSPEDRPAVGEQGPRTWLGRLSAAIAGLAGGMTVNDVSGSLGYHGLAGVIALAGVVMAAVWIRGLDPRARLSRRSPQLFLIPAGAAAMAAAFSSGSLSRTLTAAAALLTVGVVLVVREMRAAQGFLVAAGGIALAAIFFESGAAAITGHRLLEGAAFIAGGVLIMAMAAATIGDLNLVAAGCLLVAGIAGIAFGIAFITDHAAFAGAELLAGGLALLAGEVAFIAGFRLLAVAAVGFPLGAILLAMSVLTVARDGLFGIAGIVDGAVAIATAVACATGTIVRTAMTAMLAVLGGTGLALGIRLVADRQVLPGMVFIILGASFAAGGVAEVGAQVLAARLRKFFEWAAKAPPR